MCCCPLKKKKKQVCCIGKEKPKKNGSVPLSKKKEEAGVRLNVLFFPHISSTKKHEPFSYGRGNGRTHRAQMTSSMKRGIHNFLYMW